MSLDRNAVARTLEIGHRLHLLTQREIGQVTGLFEGGHPLASAVALADSLHVHIKVDDTAKLPDAEIRAAGGAVENGKEGYVKYSFGAGVNLIFSSIDVSEDDLREKSGPRKPRPFLDHVGIDLRRETDDVRAAFDAIPALAQKLAWPHVPQGGPGKPVFCCHTHVSAKHWVFPKDAVAIELALGPLKIEAGKSGCDLRPSDPSLGLAPVACGAHADEHATDGATDDGGYYRRADLGRFGEMGNNRKDLTDKFFAWYGAVFAEGALTAREKSLIALAVAHAVQCPYCIDAYSDDAQKKGANLDQMTEAVHVAAAIRGGASLVHGVQMRGHVHRHET